MDEVTRLCSSIMMMKNGLIIDQGKPNDLVKKHGRQTLEEVFETRPCRNLTQSY